MALNGMDESFGGPLVQLSDRLRRQSKESLEDAPKKDLKGGDSRSNRGGQNAVPGSGDTAQFSKGALKALQSTTLGSTLLDKLPTQSQVMGDKGLPTQGRFVGNYVASLTPEKPKSAELTTFLYDRLKDPEGKDAPEPVLPKPRQAKVSSPKVDSRTARDVLSAFQGGGIRFGRKQAEEPDEKHGDYFSFRKPGQTSKFSFTPTEQSILKDFVVGPKPPLPPSVYVAPDIYEIDQINEALDSGSDDVPEEPPVEESPVDTQPPDDQVPPDDTTSPDNDVPPTGDPGTPGDPAKPIRPPRINFRQGLGLNNQLSRLFGQIGKDLIKLFKAFESGTTGSGETDSGKTTRKLEIERSGSKFREVEDGDKTKGFTGEFRLKGKSSTTLFRIRETEQAEDGTREFSFQGARIQRNISFQSHAELSKTRETDIDFTRSFKRQLNTTATFFQGTKR